MFGWFGTITDASKRSIDMTEFVQALFAPDLSFLRYAFFVGILSSVAFGIVGTYVVTRRISYLAGAIAHAVLGGIGIALYLERAHAMTWVHPGGGALVAALLAAVIVGWISMRSKEREDTVIGALWAIGMALGLIFLAKTPGYVDPMSFLFGDVLLISRNDLFVIAGLDLLVVGLALFFYRDLMAVCFDEEFSRLRGLPVGFLYLLLVGLTALTIVLLIQMVGIVLVIALLTLPAAIAGVLSRRLWHMMLIATLLCAAFTTSGLGISYVHDLPTGPTIILVAGAAYILVLWGRRGWKRLRPGG